MKRPLGIVYETDAKIEPKVKIIGAFPEELASADHLSGGGDGKDARPRPCAYLAFLAAPAAKAIFERYGFSLLIKPNVVTQ